MKRAMLSKAAFPWILRVCGVAALAAGAVVPSGCSHPAPAKAPAPPTVAVTVAEEATLHPL